MIGERHATACFARSFIAAPVVACVAAISAPPCGGQLAAPAGITLEQALRSALTQSPRVLIGAQQAEVQWGAWMQASAPFDARLRSTFATVRDNSLMPPGRPGAAVSSSATDNHQYVAGAEKVFRNGIALTPQVRVSRSSVVGSPDMPLGTASAVMGVHIPLLYNRGGTAMRAPQDAAMLGLEAGASEELHAAALAVRETALAYWDYAVAARRLEIARGAAERAARLVEETEALVRADERPASDLTQLRANLASRSAARTDAEQRATEARQQLGLAMGLSAETISVLPPPATELPDVVEGAATPSEDLATLLRTADTARPDLRAARIRSRAADVELKGATNALRPRLDLALNGGYVGLAQRWGVNGFVAPLHSNVPGANATVQVSYERAVTNAEARGRVHMLEAQLAQREIAARDLENRVASSVAVAEEALRRARSMVAESRRAAALYRETVENERRKFRVGTATLFDVLQAEDLSTNAQLTELAGRRAYAAARVELRFILGTLVERAAGALRLEPGALDVPQ